MLREKEGQSLGAQGFIQDDIFEGGGGGGGGGGGWERSAWTGHGACLAMFWLLLCCHYIIVCGCSPSMPLLLVINLGGEALTFGGVSLVG